MDSDERHEKFALNLLRLKIKQNRNSAIFTACPFVLELKFNFFCEHLKMCIQMMEKYWMEYEKIEWEKWRMKYGSTDPLL